MRTLFEEISFLIPNDTKEKMWTHIIEICEKTAENWSSMQRDLEHGRQTELDAILGYIILIAEQKGKKLPLTEFIYISIKGLEGLYKN
jgi:2-dehydropantoate 2-reductase